MNRKPISINRIIKDRKVRKSLVLSTTGGRCEIKQLKNIWNPVYDIFRNHRTIKATPIRNYHRGKAYGSNISYIVEFWVGDSEEIVGLRKKDYTYRKFKNFALTKESLESKVILEKYLEEQKEAGKLTVKGFNVIDLDQWRRDKRELADENPVEIASDGWFAYHVLGPIQTTASNWKMRRKNREAQRELVQRKQSSDVENSP